MLLQGMISLWLFLVTEFGIVNTFKAFHSGSAKFLRDTAIYFPKTDPVFIEWLHMIRDTDICIRFSLLIFQALDMNRVFPEKLIYWV